MTYYCKDTNINYVEEKISLKTGNPMNEDEFREHLLFEIRHAAQLDEKLDNEFELKLCIKNDVCITSLCSWVQAELDKIWENKRKYEVLPIEGNVIKISLVKYLTEEN